MMMGEALVMADIAVEKVIVSHIWMDKNGRQRFSGLPAPSHSDILLPTAPILSILI